MQRLLFVFILACLPTTAAARCEGVIVLSRLHDAYLAMTIETGAVQANAARAVLVFSGDQDTTALIRQIRRSDGQLVAERRLSKTVRTAQELAQLVLMGKINRDDLFEHHQNINWLSDAVNRSNCREEIQASMFFSGSPSVSSNKDPVSEDKMPLIQLLGAASVVMTAIGVYLFLNSRMHRKIMVERMPRRSVSIELELICTTTSGDAQQTTVKALDISAGGMKLDWPDNDVGQGSAVTISLPSGPRLASVMWANAYYAGVMFDEKLSKKELAGLSESAET